MKFEWDTVKNQSNIEKHGVSFEDASKIFQGFTLDAIDERFSYGEERIVSIGIISGIAIIVVAHTDRDGVCRIISARPATRMEKKLYYEALPKTFDA